MTARTRGSFTVEAALIMPIVIFVIVVIIYLTFYLHDICRINVLVDKALYRAQFLIKHDVDFGTGEIHYQDINKRGVFYPIMGDTEKEEKDITNYVSMQLERGLLLANITDITTSIKGSDINITVKFIIQLPSSKVLEYISPNKSLTIDAQGKLQNCSESVRISEVVLDTGAKIKGMDKLKQKFERLIK